MKKIFLVTLLISLVSCSSDQKQKEEGTTSVYPPRDVISKDSLSKDDKACKDLLTILENSPVDLRFKGKDFHVILGLEDKKMSIRLLKFDGDDLFFEEVSTSLKELQSFFEKPKANLKFKTATLEKTEAFTYKILSEGAIEANFKANLKALKKTYPLTLSFIVNVESFNALNFWDGNPNNTPQEQMYIYDFLTPQFSNYFEPRIQKAKIDSVLKAVRLAGLPEVIALQEVESAEGKNENFFKGSYFRNEMEKLGYRSFILGPQEKNNPMALTTAFISRMNLNDEKNIPFNTESRYFENFPKFERRVAGYTARDIQVASLSLLGKKVFFFNNHWRSQGCSDEESCERSEEIRVNNAKVLLDYLTDLTKKNPETPFLILGDMNTDYFSDILKKMNSTGKGILVQEGKNPLIFYNLWYELPEEKRYDASNGGTMSTLSQMLINSHFFTNSLLQYVPQSFFALGQDDGPAKEILINADGNPFRWQEMKYKEEQTMGATRDELSKVAKERECHSKRSKARNCRLSYTEYAGVGYFDHLSIQGSFRFVGSSPKLQRTDFKKLSATDDVTKKRIDIEYNPCPIHTFAPYPDVFKVDFRKKEFLGQCLRFNIEGVSRELKNEGVYQTAYIETPFGKLGLSLLGSFDPRGVKDGKYLDVPKGQKMHPLSHQCFQRKVLQSSGGKVRSAMGRLGYNNGLLTLFMESPERIILENLPEEKQKACSEN